MSGGEVQSAETAQIDSRDLDHHPMCENTGADGMGCNCGAYARAVGDAR